MSSTLPSPTAASRAQSIDYAADQVAMADKLLRQHEHADANNCTCGRPRPCPQRRTLTGTARHYQNQLALLNDHTLAVPVVSPASVEAAPATNRLSRLTARVRRS